MVTSKLLSWMVLSLVGLAVATTHGQQPESMPWYDAEAGSVVPLGVQPRDATTLDERDSIPIKPTVQPINAPRRNWGTFNWTGWPKLMTTLIWIGGGLLVVLLIGLAVWAFLSSRFGDAEPEVGNLNTRSIEESIKQLPFELQARGGNFLQQAREAYHANDLSRAIALLFSHVLVQMDQRGVVRLKKGKTNRQYLSELRPHQSLASYYAAVMVQFEKSFFGNHPVPPDEFESNWNGLERFEQELENTRLGTNE